MMANYQRGSLSSGRVYHRCAKPRKGVARAFGESADWSDHQGCEALYTNKLTDLIKSLRPNQWFKNLLLLAAPFFAYFDQSQAEGAFIQTLKDSPITIFSTLGLALLAFLLISAATYVMNDLHDIKADSGHPLKKTRPIAAKKVSFSVAIPLAVACLGSGLTAAMWVGMRCNALDFLFVCVGYCALQVVYTFIAKRVADLGVVLLAAGFLLRAVAGAVVVQVHLSAWLMLCVFSGALLVGLCKRRSAFFVKGCQPSSTNEPRILDIEIGVTASVTAACYALYTLAPKTIEHFQTENLIYTFPFVLLGLFRYLRLTYQEQRAGAPETLFLRDPVLVLSGVLWIITCGIILSIAA